MMSNYVGTEITSIKYHVQTRRKSHDHMNTYLPWRIVFDADTEEGADRELQAHLDSGYKPDCVRKVRRIIIEEEIK